MKPDRRKTVLYRHKVARADEHAYYELKAIDGPASLGPISITTVLQVLLFHLVFHVLTTCFMEDVHYPSSPPGNCGRTRELQYHITSAFEVITFICCYFLILPSWSSVSNLCATHLGSNCTQENIPSQSAASRFAQIAVIFCESHLLLSFCQRFEGIFSMQEKFIRS